MQYPQVQPVDPLGEYLKHFFKSNAPRIARFFYDMYKITDEYIGNVSQEIIQNPVNYCPPHTNP